MARGRCKQCGQPIEAEGPRYCGWDCWVTAASRRRAVAARRARERRDRINAAAYAAVFDGTPTTYTAAAVVVTRTTVNGVTTETTEPVA